MRSTQIYSVFDDVKAKNTISIDHDGTKTMFIGNMEWGVVLKFNEITIGVPRENSNIEIECDIKISRQGEVFKFKNQKFGLAKKYRELRPAKQIVGKKYNLQNRFGMVDVEIHVRKVDGSEYIETPCEDIMDQDDDVILLIEKKKIRVNKKYLAMYSQYFKTLFYSNFKESTQKEIEIQSAKYETFCELLRVTYPCHKRISFSNYYNLLTDADRFDIPYVIRLCQVYYVNASNVEKLVLAEKHEADEIKEDVFSKINSYADANLLRRELMEQGICAFAQLDLHEKMSRYNNATQWRSVYNIK